MNGVLVLLKEKEVIHMQQFAKLIKLGNIKEVNTYIDLGWELIEVENKARIEYEYGVSGVNNTSNFVLGLSYKILAEKYKEIITMYEEKGFKNELYKNIEAEFDENQSDYDTSSYFDDSYVLNEFTKTINFYEYWSSDLMDLKRMYRKEDANKDYHSDDDAQLPF